MTQRQVVIILVIAGCLTSPVATMTDFHTPAPLGLAATVIRIFTAEIRILNFRAFDANFATSANANPRSNDYRNSIYYDNKRRRANR